MRPLAIFALLFLLGLPLRAEEAASPADAAAIRAVIESQLAAFQRDDGEEAFAYASPQIRERFATAANFMRMVREGYAAVYRPRDTAFGALAADGEHLVQRVLLIGPDGRPVDALYIIEREADGSWRIAGCILTQTPDKTS